MKGLAVLLVSAGLLVAVESGIDGKWITEMHMDSADGRSFTNTTTFALKNDHGVLTGSVAINGRSLAITDGKLDGNKFAFRVSMEGNKGVKTFIYEGALEGDRLKGNLKVRGIGQVWPFEAKRAD